VLILAGIGASSSQRSQRHDVGNDSQSRTIRLFTFDSGCDG